MGRKKKIKTIQEKEEYKIRRREQNKLNQENFRKRRKILNTIKLISSKFRKELKYKQELSNFLKNMGFNYFITLTTKQPTTYNNIKRDTDYLITSLSIDNQYDRLFYVIEKGKSEHLHIHILLKSNCDFNKLYKIVKRKWNNGFVYVKTIYSSYKETILENYVIKEVSLNSNNWWIW
jgi:hypothetical protein